MKASGEKFMSLTLNLNCGTKRFSLNQMNATRSIALWKPTIIGGAYNFSHVQFKTSVDYNMVEKRIF
jgi:hypothetical protein